jgi:pimeloyl-ACP methyl ester carboxylesterase
VGLHHAKRGAGKPLVLIHGLGGTHSVWDPILERVEAERQSIAVDLPGFGRSPPLPAGIPGSPANLARAVMALCAELGVERPGVAGISLGGWIALELAKLDVVESVVALSPAGLWRRPLGLRRFESHRAARFARPLVNLLLTTPRGRRLLLRTSAAHPERIPAVAAREIVTGWLDSPGYGAADRGMRVGAFEHAGRIRVPVTVAWAELDRVIGPPSHELMPPGARYEVLPGCGHIPTWDDPARVTDLLLEASSTALDVPRG